MSKAPADDDFMTPTDVVHDLSFEAPSPNRPTHRPSYLPLAPPPASPPPLPPPLDALQQPLPSSFSNTSSTDDVLLQSSYQHSSSSSQSRRAEMPRVTHYTDRNTSSYRGDASLRPNTGEINSAEGEALNERLHRLTNHDCVHLYGSHVVGNSSLFRKCPHVASLESHFGNLPNLLFALVGIATSAYSVHFRHFTTQCRNLVSSIGKEHVLVFAGRLVHWTSVGGNVRCGWNLLVDFLGNDLFPCQISTLSTTI